MGDTKRLAYLRFSADELIGIIKGEIVYEIPDDSKIFSMSTDTWNRVDICIESASFPEVPEGGEADTAQLMCHHLDDGPPFKRYVLSDTPKLSFIVKSSLGDFELTDVPVSTTVLEVIEKVILFSSARAVPGGYASRDAPGVKYGLTNYPESSGFFTESLTVAEIGVIEGQVLAFCSYGAGV